MEYSGHVRFIGDRYEYHNNGNYIYFSSDKSHKELFSFVECNILELQHEWQNYVERRIDTKSLKCKDPKHNKIALSILERKIKSVHPYFKYEYEYIVCQTTSNYFNSLLRYATYELRNVKGPITLEWHTERIQSLTMPLLHGHSMLENNSYNEYQESVGEIRHYDYDFSKEEEYETFAYGVPSTEPTIFSEMIYIQNLIRDMLYCILDIDAPKLSQLTLPQRIWFFTYIHGRGMSLNISPQKLNFSIHPGILDEEERTIQYDLSLLLNNKGFYELAQDKNDPFFSDCFKTVYQKAKMFKSSIIYEEYKIKNVLELLYLEIMAMAQSKIMIRRCHNCKRYFIVKNKKVLYCNRKFEKNKTCSQIGSQKKYEQKLKDDPDLANYMRAYKRHYARYKKNKDLYSSKFSEWAGAAREKLDQVRSGELTSEDFNNWLAKNW